MQLLQKMPASLQARLQDALIEENREGMSGAGVFRLERSGQPDQYLKVGERYSEQDLSAEVSRLLWLRGRLPAPEVLYWSEQGTRQNLLMSAVSGLPLYEEAPPEQLPALMRLYADGLRQIHSIPVEGCPFDTGLDVKIAQAAQRVQAGLIDVDNFDPERQGRSAQSLFRELLAARPQSEDLVFTHGDYCTPNVMIDGEMLVVTGFIDWGRAGIADRYTDLALAARSIDYNFGAAWIKPFFEAYGIEPDPAKVAFYKLLDEFF
jgi:aminoglycoside phosphotransferase